MKHDWLWQAKLASWWLVWEDLEWPDPIIEEKWEKRAGLFQQQGVNTVVIFGFHLRWDYLIVMDRVWEILARISDICHSHGLRVVEHHSAILVHRVRNVQDRWKIRTDNHHHVPFYPDSWENLSFEDSRLADWRQVSARNGEPVYVERYNSVCFCPNNPEYQKAYIRLIEKHIERVSIDALMSDDVHFPPDVYSCSCGHCRAKFLDESGVELPPVSEKGFWENRENPDLQKWIESRYRWNAEHYQRLRKFLPEEIALWGCASNCTGESLADIGFSPQHCAFHWDAVFHEIYHKRQMATDKESIVSEITAFASIARQLRKPLVAIFYVNKSEDLPAWLDLMAGVGARPWVCRQVRNENVIAEEELLKDGFNFPRGDTGWAGKADVGIMFSQKRRDRLPPEKAARYVSNYRELCNQLIRQGHTVEVIFDEYRDKTDYSGLQQIWTIENASAPRAADSGPQENSND